MRAQRAKMVQKVEQYSFLYMAVIEYALRKDYLDPAVIDVSSFLDTARKNIANQGGVSNEP